jgi:predicted transcriptional regulator
MQDMNEDYSRGSGKEYLRQEYIHELRSRFEDEIRQLEQLLIAEQNARRYDLVARNQVEHLLAKVVTEIEKWQQVDQER